MNGTRQFGRRGLAAKAVAGMLALMGMTVPYAMAAVYYVDAVGGDNGHAGTYAAPFATITHALTQAGDDDEIRVLPGTYSQASGETFPLSAGKVDIVGYDDETTPASDPSGHIVTGAGATPAATLFAYGSGDAATLANLTLTGATGGAVTVNDATLDIVNCVLRDMTAAPVTGIRMDGNATAVTASNVLFKANWSGGAATQSATISRITGTGTFTAYACVWQNNTNAPVSAQNAAGIFAFDDCLFEGNHSSIALFGAALRLQQSGCVVDRCRFIDNTGTSVIGRDQNTNHSFDMRNSLFADNTVSSALLHVRRLAVTARNMTFADNAAGQGLYRGVVNTGESITFYNCIIASNSLLNGSFQQDDFRVYDTVIWDTPPGLGYHPALHDNVMAFDPEFIDANGGDYRLVPWSAAIDAGNDDHVLVAMTLDLDRNPRTLDGIGDTVQIVDLGAYESTYFQPQVSSFLLEKPVYAMFGGTTVTFDVAVSPAQTEAVDVDVATDGPLQSPGATIAAGGSATLSVTADAGTYGATGALHRATLSESTTPALGVPDLMFGMRLYDRHVTHGAPDRLFVRAGDVVELPVRLIDDIQGGSISSISIATGTAGAGDNIIAWQGGADIALGAVETAGYLRIEAVSGVNTVTLTVSVDGGDPSFTFAESGALSASFDVIAVSRPVYVSGTGSDATGLGTAGSPLRSITYALSWLRDGDEIAVLPGTYGPEFETFPIQPGGVVIRGYGDVDAIVIDAQAGAEPVNLFFFGPAESGILDNLTLTGANAGAILVANAGLNIRNCVLRDMTAAPVTGIRIDGNAAAVTASNVLFKANWSGGASTQSATINSITGTGTFTAYACVWQNNTNAPVSAQSAAGIFAFYDCLFEGNHSSIALFGAALRLQQSGCVVERCRFINNTGTSVIGRDQNTLHTFEVRNSLFAGNAVSSAVLHVRRLPVTVRNSTFVDNTATDGLYQRVANITQENITFYNSIIASNSLLNNSGSTDNFRIYDTVIWDTPPGLGYHPALHDNVMEFDPEFVDRDGSDYRLVPWSQAIDAGNDDHVLVAMTLDLDRNPRTLDGTGDETAHVDLGAYESTFFHPRVPAFRTTSPTFAMFGGGTIELDLMIDPSVSTTVEASIASDGDEAISADPVTFVNGGQTVSRLTAAPGNYGAGAFYRITITETTKPAQGVRSGLFGVEVFDTLLTHGMPDRFFVRPGEVVEIPVTLLNTNIAGGSPSDITIDHAVAGDGQNVIIWSGGNVIDEGDVATGGHLRIEGVEGSQTVTLTASVPGGRQAFTFIESGTELASFEVIGLPMPFHVSGAGSDATGLGTAGSPLRSITYALSWLLDGDEIAVLPGTYGPEFETFPIQPGGVVIRGYGDVDAIIIDAQADADPVNLFFFGTDQSGMLDSLTLTGANAGAIFVSDATLDIRNCVLRDMTAASVTGIRLDGNATAVTASNVLFKANWSGGVSTQSATVRRMTGTGTFTAYACVWQYNTNAPVFSPNAAGIFAFYDCLFEGNHSSIAEYGSALRLGQTGCVVERCRFIDNTGTSVIGRPENTNHGFELRNSLFAGNTVSSALLHVRRLAVTARNVTFADNAAGQGLYRGVANAGESITFYNCIIASNSLLNDSLQQDDFRIYDTVIWDTPPGLGYHATLNDNVMAFDPEFRNAMDGDYRPRHVSAALDAGNNDSVAGEWDLDGNPRIVDHNRDKQAIVDLGAYELPPPRRGILMIAR